MNDKQQLEETYQAWLGDTDPSTGGNRLTNALDNIFSEGPSVEETRLAQSRLEGELESRLGPVVYTDDIPSSPIGRIFIAVTDYGVIEIEFDVSEAQFIEQIRKRGFHRFVHSGEKTQAVRDQVNHYLTGDLAEFDLHPDLTGLTPFQRDVLRAASEIPRGQVKTYGQIAKELGRPKSSRAVGRALGSNPIPIVIPCHRVIGSDGSLRGYSGGGGIQSKAFLLELEGAQLTGT